VRANADYLRSLLRGKVAIGRSQSWVIPVIYGIERNTIPLADFLQREGLEGSVMEFPAVPVAEARIRLFVTSEHRREELERAADIVLRAAHRFDFATST
jgi:glycine C-acetyltransferase